jgi:probable F420-dependent oxidoreductase
VKYAVIAPGTTGVAADPVWIRDYAQAAEGLGFESLVVVEHTVVIRGSAREHPYAAGGEMANSDDCDLPDPLAVLGFLSGCTSTLGLATGVLVLPNHHPVPLAKRVATLDALAGGRVRLCVGMGWMREEIEACGAPFDARGRRGDEQIEVLRALWTGEPVDHKGEFFAFEQAICRPARQVPIHVGGHSVAAARRAGRIGDGLQPLGVAGDDLRRLVDEMHTAAVDAGRDPAALELSLGHLVGRVDADKAEKLASLGAHRVVLDPTPTTDLAAAVEELTSCADRLGLT